MSQFRSECRVYDAGRPDDTGCEPAPEYRQDRLDIKRMREGYNLTQEQFAAMLGISVRSLRNWEQGRRVPEGPGMVLLSVAEKHPEAVLDAVKIVS